MLDPKSDYALNKVDKEAIVCPSATGVHTRLTREDFASEEEFLYWKSFSDSDYHDTEKAEHVQANHTRPLDTLPDTETAAPSVETQLISRQEKNERGQFLRLLMEGMDSHLTPTQRRRLWLYCAKGLTVRQIAEAEHVSHPSVVESLLAAKKKILKLLK